MASATRAYRYSDYTWGTAAPAVREPRREPAYSPSRRPTRRSAAEPTRRRASASRAAASVAPERTRTLERASRVEVVSGRRASEQTRYLSPSALALAKGIAIFFCVFALMCVGRVALNSIAAASAMQAQEISSELTQARSSGNALEVRLGAAANSNHIKSAANALGMAVATNTEVIALSRDVVATDEAGNLSFSLSAQRLVESS